MSTENIPVIDFSTAADQPGALSETLLQACASWGFFYVRGHSIPQQDIDECFSIVKSFFSQAEDVNNRAAYIPSRNAGYKAAGTYSSGNKGIASQKSDPRESYSMNKWTSDETAASAPLSPGLAEKRETLRAFQGQCYTLGTRILECMVEALDLPRTYLSKQHHREMANFDNFEIMHYPKPENVEVFTHRISPHTDWGSITMLFQQKIGGLQVRPPQYTSPALATDEIWVDAPVYDDCILINIGDMMEHWTAGKLHSTWHRVTSNTKFNREHGVSDRYCMAYFLHPDRDSVLRPIEELKCEGYVSRYEGEGRTAAEHIAARIGNAHMMEGVKMVLVKLDNLTLSFKDRVYTTLEELVDRHNVIYNHQIKTQGDRRTTHLFRQQLWRDGSAPAEEEADFYELAMGYFEVVKEQGVKYVEPFFDPQAQTRRGVPLENVMDGFVSVKRDAKELLGIERQWMMCFLRDMSVESAMKTYEAFLPYKDFINNATGLDSDEYDRPPKLFNEVYARASKDGFHPPYYCSL